MSRPAAVSVMISFQFLSDLIFALEASSHNQVRLVCSLLLRMYFVSAVHITCRDTTWFKCQYCTY